MLKDSGVQGEGAQSEGPAASKAGRSRRRHQARHKGSGQTNDPNAAQQTAGKGRPAARTAREIPRAAPRAASRLHRKGVRRANRGHLKQNKGDSGNQNKGQDGQAEKQAERSKDADQNSSPDDKNAAEQNDEKSSQENQNSSDASSPPSRLPSVPFQAPWWLRALFIVAGVVALIYGLFRYGSTLLDALRDLLASLFGGLFIQQPKKRAKAPEPAPSEQAPPPRPFASFANPFDSGLDQRFSPNDLVIYSFEALEAWASSTISPARPTRRRANSSAVSERLGPTCARTPRDWSDTSSRSSTARKASRRRSCRRCASSGGRLQGLPA